VNWEKENKMQLTNKVTKVLTAAVLGSLLAVSPVWAAEQTSNVTVTSSNDAGSPYKSITVTSGGGAIIQQSPELTVYLTDGAQVSYSSDSLNNVGIESSVAMPKTLTINGNMNLTVTAKNTADGAAIAYGISGDSTITLDNVTANITAAGSPTNSNGSYAYAKVIGIENNRTTKAKDLNLNLTSTGGSAITNASATAVGLKNGGSLTAGNVNVQATAIGGTISSASGELGTEAKGVENNGSIFQTGDIALNINAQADTITSTDQSAQETLAGATAFGLLNNDSTNSHKVNVGNVSGTIVATGKDAPGEVIIDATGIKNMAGSLTAQGTDLTVIANGAHGGQRDLILMLLPLRIMALILP
jgi:hypothetical protein